MTYVNINSYLKGYLDVLPLSQRKEIERVLKSYQDIFDTVFTEEEFKKVLAELADKHEPLSKILLQKDRLDPEIHNKIGANMYVDLNYLFHESLLVEKITASYEHIFDGMLADMKKEIEALEQRVDAIHFIKQGEQGLILRTHSFTSQEQLEVYDGATAHLFLDRNGKELPIAAIERSHDQYYLQLAKTKESNAALNEKGEVTAKIEVVDRRGIPLPTSDDFPLLHALDGSIQTYWGEVVLSDEPIENSMHK